MDHVEGAEVLKDARLFAELTPAALAARCPELTIGRPHPLPVRPMQGSALAAEVRRRGWAAVAAQFAPSDVEAIRDAIERLDAAALPHGAVYVFDEVWHLGAQVAAVASASFGVEYALLTDFWAFHVVPGRSGWPPHRGTVAQLDRDQPELLNVWVALSDVEIDRSCMHFIALDDDIAYAAGRLDDLPNEQGVTTASPVDAGTALFWNANIAHWGGPCLSTARGPRTSVTFTLERGAETSRCAVDETGWTRIDALVDQLLTYAPHASAEALDWARVTTALRNGLQGG